MNTHKETAIKKFKERKGSKPYKLLLTAYREEIVQKLKEGFSTQDVQTYIEAEAQTVFDPDNFRFAFYRFKKKLEESPSTSPLHQNSKKTKTSTPPSTERNIKSGDSQVTEDEKFNFDLKAEPTDKVDNFFKNIKKSKE